MASDDKTTIELSAGVDLYLLVLGGSGVVTVINGTDVQQAHRVRGGETLTLSESGECFWTTKRTDVPATFLALATVLRSRMDKDDWAAICTKLMNEL